MSAASSARSSAPFGAVIRRDRRPVVDETGQVDALAVLALAMGSAALDATRTPSGRRGVRHFKRGRRAVDVLDTIVQVAFRGDQNVLAKWQSAKRVRALPGSGGGSDAAAAVVSATPVGAA